MSASIAGTTETRELDQLIGALRPKLHRYCARMTGSTIDGEDVVQEALVKALEALPTSAPIAQRSQGRPSRVSRKKLKASENRTESASMMSTANRAGLRARPMTGTYRKSAHGPGTYVLIPAKWINGPSVNKVKASHDTTHSRGARHPTRHARQSTRTALQGMETTLSR